MKPNSLIELDNFSRSFLGVVALNSKNRNLAFLAGFDNVIYRTDNLSSSVLNWLPISKVDCKIISIHSCIGDANRLYALSDKYQFYVFDNALLPNPSFVIWDFPYFFLNKDVPSVSHIKIVAQEKDVDMVYVSIVDKLFRSKNGGITWSDVSFLGV